jgi:serine/threonine protein kinase
LQELTGETSIALSAVSLGSKLEQPSEALEVAMRNLKASIADTPGSTVVQNSGQFSLHFLRPSANPRHLGELDGYEILDAIGHGGMGTVLKARDTKLERLVAVKVLDPALASSHAARARFLREARAAAAVQHDHVVTIHAVDDSGDVPYLVMEYIVGVSLEDHIRQTGHLPLEQVLRIGLQVSAGLAAAHAQGLVHRDIKPANILLENSVERVKITDFGLVRVIHDAQLSQTAAVSGTPQYMSPEQACGECVDHRSDLFSLGCLMYAMCTGRSPFRADTPASVIHRVCEDTPRPIQEFNPEIPKWLVGIVDRLLAKRPEDRFQAAREVAGLLEQHLIHGQESSHNPLPPNAASSNATRQGVFGSHRRWVLTAALTGTLCLALAIALSPGLRSRWTGNGRQTDRQAAGMPRVDRISLAAPEPAADLSEAAREPNVETEEDEAALQKKQRRLEKILNQEIGSPYSSANPFVSAGQWDRVVEEAAKGVEAKPDTSATHRALAVARLMAGDLQGYRSACANAVRRLSIYGATNNAYLVQLCCLSSESGIGQQRMASLMQKASEGEGPTVDLAAHFYLFRSGCDEELLSRSPLRGGKYNIGCINLLNAMASQRMNRPEDAKQFLEEAVAVIDEHYTTPEGPLEGGMIEKWVHWGALQVLLGEAQQMIVSEQEDAKPTLQAGL